MSKFVLFALIVWLVGNPFLALIILIAVLYLIDRRFVGLSPSITSPLKRNRRLARLKRELLLQPHDATAKLEAARIYMEKGRYDEALKLLDEVGSVYDSADVVCETGLCMLKLGRLEEGERLILQSLETNPRVKYGEPYLRLGEAYASVDPEKAIRYLDRFRQENTSSCEGSYKLGRIYERIGHKEDAKRAYAEAVQIHRGLPRYKRRSERRWAILSRWRQLL